MKEPTPPNRMTYSVCPVCLQRIPARLVCRGGDWFMEKTCPQHGAFETIVWRGDPALTGWGDYTPVWVDEADLPDCPHGCGLCGQHLQSTCCLLVEITDRCNLRCPVCFAESGGKPPRPEKSADELYVDFCAMTAAGRSFIQLSGGEPTVRDDLPDVVRAAKRAGATSVQLNSNGIRLGAEPEFTKRLAEAGLDFVFLQFDDVKDATYTSLRGRPLMAEKEAAIRVCGEHYIGVTLVPTVVPGINDNALGAILDFAVAHAPEVRGVHFQPVSYFGRYPAPPRDSDRITLPEIITQIERQTGGRIRASHLLPSRCDHPRCGFHGDFVVLPDGLHPLTIRHPEGEGCCCPAPAGDAALRNRNFVARRWKRTPGAPAGPADLSDLDGFLARVRSHGFTVTGMAFQDAYNLDLERLRRCSLHVWDNGTIVPFCAYYLTRV